MTVESAFIHHFMVFSMFVYVFLVYLMLDDLNRPFIGYWHIKNNEYINVMTTLRSSEKSNEL